MVYHYLHNNKWLKAFCHNISIEY
ncbi:hypothetical protein DERF_002990 [Dermatophagoides farinae]|uniref:Uncharacterized protein n=1 Tax=Dermatophagoides farinae TaxID=6954 RepID=A0A922ICN2_DERFA|nr:hypothetical protein DERF_002990 [Dermatophagoides farinae]